MTPRALSIAGSDPGGGAGIQQDLKTFAAFGVWGMTAITAVTVQDTTGVRGWQRIEPETVVAQIEACARDIGVDAAKTGMLPDATTIEAVARAVVDEGIAPLVVDPVLVATSGDALTAGDAVDAFRGLLIPRAMLVAPNTDEATALTGIPIGSRADQEEAARALVGMGARAAVVTGGHMHGEEVVDVFVDSAGAVDVFAAPRAGGGPFHGTGCMLSAAVTAGLAIGRSPAVALRDAQVAVRAAIARSARLGKGAIPVDAREIGDEVADARARRP